jgi:hypothetical protein
MANDGNGEHVPIEVAKAPSASALVPRDAFLAVSVATEPSRVAVQILDRRPDCLQLFAELSTPQQEQLAQDAWMVGLRALANAYTQAQESRLQDIGKTLLEDVERQLRRHVEDQHQIVKQVLAAYFDPQDGQVVERLQRFAADDGELARRLNQYLAPSGVLAQALAEQVGESSPLFRKLSPTDSEGVIQLLTAKLEEVMRSSRTEIVSALDPLDSNGALGRFLTGLRQVIAQADTDRGKQLAAAVAAIDANDENPRPTSTSTRRWPALSRSPPATRRPGTRATSTRSRTSTAASRRSSNGSRRWTRPTSASGRARMRSARRSARGSRSCSSCCARPRRP